MRSSRPRLLVLASTFPRWEGDTEPRFVESLSYELTENFEVTVLVPHCRGAARRETLRSRDRVLEVRRFRYCPAALETLAYEGGMLSRVRSNPLRLLLLPLFLIAQMRALWRLHREQAFDAIHAHWIIPQGFSVTVLGRLGYALPPVLLTSHGGDLYALRGRFLEEIKRRILARVDAVTVVSEAMRQYCEDKKFAPGRIDVQSMGVDLDTTFTPGDSNTPREGLVFVGRLVEKKGVDYLIEAMAILAPQHPELRLKIVGDGPLRKSLEARAVEHGVSDCIEFVGSVLNVDVPGYLRSAALGVMPSVVAASGDQEGLGLVAVETMGCGCAVVASDLPAVRDAVIDGRTGLMAKPADAADLAAKIDRLLGDDALRQQLAAAGRRHALAHFNWKAVGASYARIINERLLDD
ncbi:MAG: glycosyltransferase family 4 protein [Woeseiaceae bacterium]|nr:glycosyltransferase family 4 protein [Woeseiaceae bacterium]